MRLKPRTVTLLMSGLGSMLLCALAIGQTVNAIIDEEEDRIQVAQQGQDEIDGIVATTRVRFDEYQSLLKQIEGVQVYNRLLQNQIDDQNRTLDDLRSSIEEVTVIERQVLPLMTRMIDGLERFVELDVPFLLNERQQRIANLKTLLNRSDVTAAEQFRNVMEAWQIENDYGSAPETYTDIVPVGGATREVDILKIGRVALLYLTPDGQQAGAWDHRSREWVELGDEYLAPIRQGLRVVETGQVDQAMFVIPVAPPEEQ
ncbi:DUF3450 domain-containing protein [Candidatus Rariloculus sp.]|uniref:DUF3450 domain-containing protein n=1 Tax=Candidatus Rariloculus sp. TaxID=3101265 RepID=UPI003D13546B